MKIRIKRNSIRFRLTKSEVAEFCEKGYIEERTVFEDAAFVYGIQMVENVEGLSAELKDGKILLKVSENMSADWDATNKVGFEDTFSLQNGDALHLLLEKDFTCMDDRGEDESDNYPNPKLASAPKSEMP
ncbi:MAG: hypothetical protein WA913_13640 [Pricia sp.]